VMLPMERTPRRGKANGAARLAPSGRPMHDFANPGRRSSRASRDSLCPGLPRRAPSGRKARAHYHGKPGFSSR
jgi:hypothetical protein